MNNWGYREIHGFDTLSLKQLNDTLLAMWAKVMGERGTMADGIETALSQRIGALEERVAALEEAGDSCQ